MCEGGKDSRPSDQDSVYHDMAHDFFDLDNLSNDSNLYSKCGNTRMSNFSFGMKNKSNERSIEKSPQAVYKVSI